MAPPLLEIRELSLPVRAQLAAGHDDAPNGNRTLTVVGLTIDGSTGWGECSALPRVGYTHESSGLAYDVLAGDPQIVQSGGAKGLVDRYPMAMAALEMAEFDLQLKRTGVSLAAYLGVSESIVPAGAVVSLGSAEQVHEQAAELVESGFRRLKLKVVPQVRYGRPAAHDVASLCAAFPSVEIQVDGNGSFDRSSIGEVRHLQEAGASAIEQPFPAVDIAVAAELVASGVRIIADEAATDPQTVRRLVAARACAGVVVKSGRLGGLYRAFELLSWCAEQGVPAAAGGMQESGLGRHALAVVAAHEACTLTGDVGPARRWLAEDPWPDIDLADGSVRVPDGSGVAPPPDLEKLEKYTLRMTQRTLPL